MIKLVLLRKVFQKGDVIFKEGEAGTEACLVRKGYISITKQDGARVVELATRGPGEIVGEMALLDSRPRSASVLAKTEVEAELITRKDLDAMMATMPDTLAIIMRQMLSRLRDANELAAMYAPDPSN